MRKIRKTREVYVACVKFHACGWRGVRRVKKLSKVLLRPCPKCAGRVEQYHEIVTS